MRKCLLVFGLLICNLICAQPSDTLSVLFVGNSYTYFNNLPHIVSAISDSTGTKLITKKSVVGGAHLYEHWHSKRDLRTREIIENGNFDAIVFQDHSMEAINNPDSLQKYAKLFCDLARKTGAEPYLFLVWAREKVPQYQLELDSVYSAVAEQHRAKMVPVGKAWELARNYRPDAPLFDIDGTHPSNLGTFLSAAVFVGIITGQVPEKVYQVPTVYQSNGEYIELMRLDWLDMIFALMVAKETMEKLGPQGD